jgi:predicted membrane chloride channel (bestrophin family)
LVTADLRSDDELQRQQAKVKSASVRFWLKWINADVIVHALMSAIVTGAIYVGIHFMELHESPTISLAAHLVTGLVLGMLLVARVVVGSQRASEAAAQVVNFNKSCRTLAVLSTFVTETLTISAGAEREKGATSNFRYELVRLLNLSFYTYQLMIKGLKLKTPPKALRATGGDVESEVLSAVSNPTILVCKSIASLVEKQQAAQRIKNEQVSGFVHEISNLIDSYHTTHGLLLSPMPASLNGFTYFFTMVWIYTAAPMIAVEEFTNNGGFDSAGFFLALAYSFSMSLFMFGLYEAGKIIEAPLQAVLNLVPLDDMSFTLSDDLTNLIDDPDHKVPVFLSKE